ncbi:hypothetical protein R3Q06_36485 [Rhodococcus erythropolis]|nr:hypothetical protein [Rhodococcus erythropolis]MDV6278859.1 hypothetical protein [Rhodococcus erythropolis]
MTVSVDRSVRHRRARAILAGVLAEPAKNGHLTDPVQRWLTTAG